MVISKSEFLLFLKHPAWLWLKKYDKDKLPLPDEDLQALFDEGTLFEAYAEKIFEGAVKLGYKNGKDFSGTKYYALPDLTLKEMEKGTTVILQGRVEVNNITAIFDVLERVDKNTFDLSEIKSSTRVKDDHIVDLAFQTIVLEDAGFDIRKMSVIHVNNKYVREGDVDPLAITSRTEVTAEVREVILKTRENIKRAFKVLESKKMPDISPRHLSQGGEVFEEWLKILEAIRGKLPAESSYRLYSPDPKTIAWLEDNGIELLNDIPLDAPLSEKQLRQVEAMKWDKQRIDVDEISNFLNELKYPLYFLDYETYPTAIPPYSGYHPYQQIVFQYSLHVLHDKDSEPVSFECLIVDGDPSERIAKSLREHIGDRGSVVSWFKTFENARNRELANFFPNYRDFFLGLITRTYDLMDIVENQYYVHPGFEGRSSIKHDFRVKRLNT